MKKWVRYPGPGEYRGRGEWRTIEDIGMTETEWAELGETGYLPTHEGDAPPDDPEPDPVAVGPFRR